MKSKGGITLDSIDEEWLYNCVDSKQVKVALDILSADKSKKALKRIAEERLSLLTVGPSATQKKEAETIRVKGNQCVSKEDYKGAMNFYTESIKFDPSEASSFANRSLTYLRMKDLKRAYEDSKRAIKVNKDFGRGYQRLAEVFIDQKDYKKAYIALKATLKKDPTNKTANTLMADVKKNMMEKSVSISETEAEKQTTELMAGRFSDECDEEEVKKSEPMEDIKGATSGVSTATKDKSASKASSPEVEKFFASFNKVKEEGKDHHRNGRYDEAMEKYKSCFRIIEKLKANKGAIPEDEFLLREATLNNNIAVCYKQKQEPTGVITYSTKVIDSPIADKGIKLKAYVLRGFAYEAVDKLKLAKEDWTKVKELQPDNINATKALGRVSSAMEKDEAQKKIDMVGETIRGLEEYKKRGNEFYKASMAG